MKGFRQSGGSINGRQSRTRPLEVHSCEQLLHLRDGHCLAPFPPARKYVLCVSVADLALLNLLSTTSTTISQYALAERYKTGNYPS
ncbi:MAG: hypothetical protein QXT33_05445 [Thermofilum sp.]